MKKIIGVYGLSGSGKTTFCKRLAELSCHLIDADIVAREIVEKGSPLLIKLKDEFGEEIILPDGSLNRKKLGSIVFSDKAELERLNGITWPEIDKIIKEKALEAEAEIVVIDAAMLNKVSAKDICDELVFIKADENMLADRLVKREGIEKGLAESRIRLQLKDIGTSYTRVIENNAGIDELINKTDSFYKEMKGCLK